MMSHKWLVLAGVACGTFMATLDSSIVNIALPTLTKELHTDLIHVKWIIVLYFLTITCTLLPFGRLSDVYGRKTLFTFGFIVFIIGSALCGVAGNLEVLLIFRVIQALGGSMLMANGPAIITATFPAKERGTALGTLAMSVSLGLISGPSVGGLMVDWVGWRSIFFINIPAGLVGAWMIQRFAIADTPAKKVYKFDWIGTILQSVIFLSAVWLLDPTSHYLFGLEVPSKTRWVIAAIIFFGLGHQFIRYEKKQKAPVFDVSLLQNKTFWTANLSGFMFFIAYSTISVLMPFFLEDVMHYSTKSSGILMAAVPLTILITAPLSGKISDIYGSRELCLIGSAILMITLTLMSGLMGSGLHDSISEIEIVVFLILAGVAIGIFQSPNNNAIMSAVPTAKLGVASALIATVRNMGFVFGAGFASGVFYWRNQTSDFTDALQFTFLLGGFFGFAALIAALGKSRGPYWK